MVGPDVASPYRARKHMVPPREDGVPIPKVLGNNYAVSREPTAMTTPG